MFVLINALRANFSQFCACDNCTVSFWVFWAKGVLVFIKLLKMHLQQFIMTSLSKKISSFYQRGQPKPGLVGNFRDHLQTLLEILS